jgi:hypothetical protein
MALVDKNYPLYPELNEAGNEEAQALMDKFKANAKKALDELMDEYLGTVYCNILPDIESDSWQNYRNTMMEGFKNYDNRLAQNRWDFKKIRTEIYNQHREDIIKDLDQDNLEKIAELEKTIAMLQQQLIDIRRF